MDLADVGGNVKEGCHIASMGGTWMVMAYGAAGMRDYDGTLSFHPKPDLQRTGTLRFTLTYHGQRLVVKLAPDGATYSLEEGQQLTLRHYDETIILSSENRVMSRGYQEN